MENETTLLREPLGDASMAVAILAGGLGTRLRPVVSDRPKILADVGGRPFVTLWLDALEQQGFPVAVLCTGYRATDVDRVLGRRHGAMELRYSVEENPLGTGGAVRHALPLLSREWLLILNGDSFCDLGVMKFYRSHLAAGRLLSVGVVRVADCRRYGRVEFDRDGCVRSFEEKGVEVGVGWVNAGVYLIHRSLIEDLPAGLPLSLERNLFPRWALNGIHAHPLHGRFLDIGTPESYAQAASVFPEGQRRVA